MNEGAFNAKTILVVIVAGVVGFIAFLVLLAYQPDLGGGGADGRPHALSTSAVGFRGVYDLLEETGGEVEYLREEGSTLYGAGLVIATIDAQSDEGRIDALFDRGLTQATLIVLPKWATMASPEGRDRVVAFGPNFGNIGAARLTQVDKLQTRIASVSAGTTLRATGLNAAPYRAPESLQTITGSNLTPMLQTPDGGIVLAQLSDTQTFILSDPDLLNNLAMASGDRARAAMTLLDSLNSDRGPYRFDLVVNGFGAPRNLLTLAFEPPFLALTLCILAAAILGWLQAAYRFGPAQTEPRAIAFGKRALVDNSAELLRLAKREHLSSERYIDLTREAAVAAIGNPRGLEGFALDQWLDGFTREGEPFTVLAERAQRAASRDEILSAAGALHDWRKAVTHEG